MYLFVVALHVMLCVFLVLIIILQPGKGGDVGAAFGGGSSGGSSTMFGPRGPTSLLQRATTVVAVLFMATSLTLAIYSNKSILSDSNVEDELDRLAEEQAQPAEEAAPTPVPGAAPEAPPEAAPAPVPEAAPEAPAEEPAGE